ncbi:MAG TPA: hypothetical protein VLE49_16885 [Anaerolineales bacterium]|nr:hypothetical protein [Anaerolineales bacterium]
MGNSVSSCQKQPQACQVKNNQSRGERRCRLMLTAALLCVGAIQPLQAGEFAYGLGYTAEHSDNIFRVSTNEQSDTIHSLTAGFAYQEKSIDLVARIIGQATYNTYQQDSFGDETLFDLDSSVVWTISPQRFFWTLVDRSTQGLLNSTSADTPANRSNFNVLSTGPDFYLRISPVQTLSFGARASDVYTGRANFDNKRFRSTAGWLYQSSPITTLSLNYQAEKVKYDDSLLYDDYTNEEIFLRADFRPSRSQYLIDLGVTNINYNRGNDVSGSLARLSWIRQSTPESSFGASIRKEFSDAGRAALDTALPVSQGAASTINADVYTTKGGNVFYNHRGSQFGVQFQAEKRKLDYETTPQDRDETYGLLELKYFFVSATTVTLFTEYTRTKYLNIVLRNTDQTTGLRLDYFATRSVSLGLEGRHIERDSTDPLSSYVDNRVLFTIQYSSGPLFTQLRNEPQFTPARSI